MNIAKIIDHTFLKKEATKQELQKVCQETKEYGFRCLCVFPEHTKFMKDCLKGTDIKVTTLVDEPMGSSSHGQRMETVNKAKEHGSDEIELVMKIDVFKQGKYYEVLADLKELCSVLPTKVIIGSGYLTDGEIKKASELVEEAGAICVKTATIKDPLDSSELDEKEKHIKIMRESVSKILVKASGGIRKLSDAIRMVEAGADIIGTSSGVEILQGQAQDDGRLIE